MSFLKEAKICTLLLKVCEHLYPDINTFASDVYVTNSVTGSVLLNVFSEFILRMFLCFKASALSSLQRALSEHVPVQFSRTGADKSFTKNAI
jgi:hypothetical protein